MELKKIKYLKMYKGQSRVCLTKKKKERKISHENLIKINDVSCRMKIMAHFYIYLSRIEKKNEKLLLFYNIHSAWVAIFFVYKFMKQYVFLDNFQGYLVIFLWIFIFLWERHIHFFVLNFILIDAHTMSIGYIPKYFEF